MGNDGLRGLVLLLLLALLSLLFITSTWGYEVKVSEEDGTLLHVYTPEEYYKTILGIDYPGDSEYPNANEDDIEDTETYHRYKRDKRDVAQCDPANFFNSCIALFAEDGVWYAENCCPCDEVFSFTFWVYGKPLGYPQTGFTFENLLGCLPAGTRETVNILTTTTNVDQTRILQQKPCGASINDCPDVNPTLTPTPTPTPIPPLGTRTPKPTNTPPPNFSGTPIPVGTPTPSRSRTPTPTHTKTPTPTRTRTPTPTKTPTPTPTPAVYVGPLILYPDVHFDGGLGVHQGNISSLLNSDMPLGVWTETPASNYIRFEQYNLTENVEGKVLAFPPLHPLGSKTHPPLSGIPMNVLAHISVIRFQPLPENAFPADIVNATLVVNWFGPSVRDTWWEWYVSWFLSPFFLCL